MRTVFATLTTTTIFGLFLGLSACKKDDKVTTPEPVNSVITGQISPRGSVVGVQADGVGRTYTASVSDSSNLFVINNVVPGSYTVSFQAAAGFPPPATRTVEVQSGSVADMGLISGLGTGGSKMRFAINGGNQEDALTATAIYQGGTLTVVGITKDRGTLTINLNNMNGPGAYSLDAGVSVRSATYRDSLNHYWTTVRGAGTGGVLISAFDPNARTISGNFNFRAYPYNASTTGTVSVTNGEFNGLTF